ncbi:MAG: hypothetical protein QNI99_21555 [Woeseiaceae bacterium]|nr:hypothetical protein [Woeseiaceae bacterium]
MMTNTRIAAFLAVAALSLIPAARASAHHQNDRVEVYVVYESMPDETERARTAALGARIVWESADEPVRILSIPANSLAAIQRGPGVLRVALEAERDLEFPAA